MAHGQQETGQPVAEAPPKEEARVQGVVYIAIESAEKPGRAAPPFVFLVLALHPVERNQVALDQDVNASKHDGGDQ